MKIKDLFSGLLYHKGADLDNPETTLFHRQIILSKPFLKDIYNSWYRDIINALNDIKAEGTVLEIGSGGGFFREIYPNVITSDILPLDCCDIVLDAQALPYEEDSLKAITMINVFHHIPNCGTFLSEAQRTLKTGGKVIMVEPANSLWSRLINQNFHHEPFEPDAPAWEFESTGPLSSSNQALPYIVFERDKNRFAQSFPNLRIKSIRYHSPLSYLLSGGVSRRPMVPLTIGRKILAFENKISSRKFNMYCTIVLEKV